MTRRPNQRCDADPAIDGALLRVLLIASFGSFLLNLSSTTVNVAIDQLMVDLARAALRPCSGSSPATCSR